MNPNGLGVHINTGMVRRYRPSARRVVPALGDVEMSPETCVGPGYRSLGDVVDVLYSQPTLNERRN
jgi:CHAD domain-containing protein